MNLKLLLLLLFFYSGLIACSANPESTKKMPAPTPTKRALLIGIDKYPFVNQLNGCVNDVKGMKQLLITKFDFPEQEIMTLEDGQATRKAILTALHNLISSAQPNDVIVIHYSGHGSQIVDPADDEIDGFDETIIPYDYQNVQGGSYPITDKQICGALSELWKKTKNITIVLDCCHSGGGTKDLALGLRVIPKDKRVALQNDDFLIQNRTVGNKTPLKSDLSAYVLLAGCRSDQVSYEIGLDQGLYHGIFSYYLINALQRAGGSMTWQEVMEDVRTHVRESHADQSPQLEGLNKNSFVFGNTYIQKRVYVTAQPVGDYLITLDGGLIYGFTVGSAFDIFPKGTVNFTSGKIATAVITKVSSFQSEAKVISGNVNQANSRAIETSHVFNKSALLIRFIGPNSTAFQSIKNDLLSIDGMQVDNLHPDLTLYQKGGCILFCAGRDTTDYLESIDLSATNSNTVVKAAVASWLNWFRVAKVDNRNPSLPITISVKLDPTEKAINLNAPDYVFKNNTKAILVIKNQSTVPLFISIIDLQDNTNIDIYTASQFKDPANTSNQPLAPGATYSAPFTVQNIGTKKISRDVMKVIAATTDLNFDLFKQARGAAPKVIIPGQTALTTSGQWTSVDRVIFAERPSAK